MTRATGVVRGVTFALLAESSAVGGQPPWKPARLGILAGAVPAFAPELVG